MGRPETDQVRQCAMNQLGNGLHDADRHEDALSVREAELSMEWRLGGSEHNMLIAQGNLANTYKALGRLEEAMSLRQEVYSGRVRLDGEEHGSTLLAANNYASSLFDLQRFKEAKELLRKTIPVGRRVLGDSQERVLNMRSSYAEVLYLDDGATHDDLREAVTTLEDTTRIARRVLGGAHPFTVNHEQSLRNARAALSAREESFRRDELTAARAASDALNAELVALIEASRLRAREESVRLREAASRLREEAVLHEDRAAAAQAASDAPNAELEASRLENARAALRARETPPPSSSPSESA